MLNKQVAGASNFQRRTWDKAEYEKRAAERSEREAPGGSSSGPRGRVDPPPVASSGKLTLKDGFGEAAPYRNAEYGVAGPEGSKRAYLKSREEDLNLEAKVNQRRVITDATPLNEVGGYHCELCQCTLTDSSTWLDHINGTKHQRRMGLSMRVEAAGVDKVKARLAGLKASSSTSAASAKRELDRAEALAELNLRVARATEEERARKKSKMMERGGGDSKVSDCVKEISDGGEVEKAVVAARTVGVGKEEEVVAGGEQEDMAAIMGFSNFGR